MVDTAVAPLVLGTNGGKGNDIANFVHDAGRCKGALLIVLLNKLRKFLRVANLEQVNVLHIPEVVDAHAARPALAQLANVSDGIDPALWIERAIVDYSDRVGQGLRGDPIEPVHNPPIPLNG
jgi:hypothetical protein